MNRYTLLIFIFLSRFAFGQSTIRIISTETSTKPYIANYSEIKPEIINDSIFEFKLPVIYEPENLYIVLDDSKQPRIVIRAWIDETTKLRIIHSDKSQLITKDDFYLDFEDLPITNIDNWYRNQFLIMKKSEGNKTHFNSDDLETIMLDSLRSAKISYIKNSPKSFLSIVYLSEIMFHNPINSTQNLLNSIDSSLSKYKTYENIQTFINSHKENVRKVIFTNDSFFDFKGINENNDTINSCDIHIKIILLDFWYSSCGPCKRSIPILKELYSRYKNYDFEIISFSVDEPKEYENWLLASKLNNVPWINVTDKQGFYGKIANVYDVESFPFFLLFYNKKLINRYTGLNDLTLIDSEISRMVKKAP